MNLLFDLSKEYKLLPALEIVSIIESYHCSYSILYQNNAVLILRILDASTILDHLISRLAYTYNVSEFLFQSSPQLQDIEKHAKQTPLILPGSIAIRHRNRSTLYDSRSIIKTLGKIYTKDRRVDLQHPERELNVIITDEHIFVGTIIKSIDRKQYDQRKVQYRPFFSPISLHPRLARGLVNLAHITEKSTILDPFCGTGGFLIEAGLIGCTLYGSDIQDDMIQGTQQNLSFYGLKNAHLFQSDIASISTFITQPIDAIITDAPYGKSTTTNKEPLDTLYHRSFKFLSNILDYNGTIVIGLPKDQYITLFTKYFLLNHILTIPVHRSLTRYFYIGTQQP